MRLVFGKVLVVDDDKVFRERLVRAFRDREIEADCVPSVEGASEWLSHNRCSHITLDLKMQDGSGLELLRVLSAKGGMPDVVVLTGYGSVATALEAVRLGARNFLHKPASVEQILRAFDQPSSSPERENTYTAPSLAELEYEHISRVVQDSGGNISLAAKALGIHRRSLQRKLAKRPKRRL